MPPDAERASPVGKARPNAQIPARVTERDSVSTVTRRPGILACALWLAARRGFVFPLDHPGLPECAGAHKPGQPCDGQRGKHPCGRWSRDSTTDPAEIRRAFRGLRNAGIDCGRSGLLVVDEDRPGAFGEYAASIGEQVPGTFTVVTGKGQHFYFAQPAGEPLGNSPGQLAGRGIDIRGAGGYVVAPGSVHASGVLYAPADSAAPVLPAPAWLVSALRPAGRLPAQRGGRGTTAGPAAGSVYGRLRGALAVVLDAPQGERNNRLYWAACRAAELVAAGDVDEGTAGDLLARAAESAGLGLGESQATINSAMRRVSA